MTRLLITAINKTPRDDRYEHIQRFGGIDMDTNLPWEAPFDEAIAMAKSPHVHFFVHSTKSLLSPPISVGLYLSNYGNLCLRSDPNGVEADNLLSLPELSSRNMLSGLMNSSSRPTGFGIIEGERNKLARLALADALKKR
ncbi:DUF3892 domain-containing protein [Polaromonas sp. CF318]|uniref:DUF3892 domain-containing protein n=1 Tax=Polaromonas sp. CF318 TaxID=1144318 RepID=UPI0012F9A4BB|nr:DUF3892 domain-containing protein [Polaromonas sp. CF318]